MKGYDLIAFDMDGTLLTSSNTISPRVKRAVHAVVERGKQVVICTGRSLMELSDYEEDFKKIRYYICENGTFIYDSFEKKVISAKQLEPRLLACILEVVENQDVMLVYASNGQNITSGKDARRMEYFHAERYKDLELRTAILVDDVIKGYQEKPVPVEKLNIYSAAVEIRDAIYQAIRHLPVTIVYAEDTGLEVTPLHTSKGVAFRSLCEYLNISIENAIAVGDSDNDVEMLKSAGLAVAMGNAFPHVKEICDVIVSDHDHDGCAEVMENI